MKLLAEALVKFACGVALVGLLIFLPAGTLSFFYGWLFMGLLFIPMFLAGIVMLIKAPQLLKKRLDAKEKQSAQKGVLAFSGLMFVGGFVVAGLDHRFGWSYMPPVVTAAGSVLFVLGYLLFALVLRQNAYLSRTVKVEEGQTVVDTGLYSIVRHPMYAVTLLLFLSMPLVLGSLISFVIFLVYPLLIAKRIRNEEQVLEAGLPGYKEYKQKVKYRMIPFIW